MKRWLPKFCHLLCHIWAIFQILISPEQYFYYQKVLILAIIDDLVNDEHMVITWVTFTLEHWDNQQTSFLPVVTSGYWLFSFANQVQEHFYSWMLFMQWAFFGPSSPLRTFKRNDHSDKNKNTILTKTKCPLWKKQNDHSDKKNDFSDKTQQVLLFSPDSLGSSRAGP